MRGRGRERETERGSEGVSERESERGDKLLNESPFCPDTGE